MTSLTRAYLAGLTLLVLGLAAMVVDASTAARSKTGARAAVCTAMPGNSLSVPYLEARWRVLGDDSGALFPGMRPLSTMDFVYAQ